MGAPEQAWPALVVTSGPQRGQSFTIADGAVVLGRETTAELVLDGSMVSRRHARLRSAGGQVLLEDLGSTNGTFVNGDRLAGTHRLTVGDRIRVGDVDLQFGVIGMAAPLNGQGPASSFDFGNVSGPVNAGEGAMNVGHGRQYVAGRDFHHGDKINFDVKPVDDTDDLFEGTGPWRVVAVLGYVVAFSGFGLWAALIFSGMNDTDPSGPTPFDLTFAGVPVAAIAFAMFLLGGLTAGVGRGMARAARRRKAAPRPTWHPGRAT